MHPYERDLARIAIDEITSRRGFRQVWDECDLDVQKEIIKTLREKMREYLHSPIEDKENNYGK